MRKHFKKIILNLLGWAFILLGMLGVVLPILPGFVFLIIGLTILSSCNHWSKSLLDTFRRRFPYIAKKTDQLLKKLRIYRQ